MDNASDRKSIRRKEKAARLAEVSRAAVITEVMSTIQGRQWLWDLLGNCHIFSTTFNPEPSISAFQEGQRNVGLFLLADIMAHCPDQYIQAMRESNERYHSDLNSAPDDPSAERPSGPIPDGGDLGTSSDPEDDGDRPTAEHYYLGADIYIQDPGPGKAN
jgi:hypothetical protein